MQMHNFWLKETANLLHFISTVYFAHVTHVIFLRQSICHIVFCQMYVACNKTILSNKPRKKYTSRWFLLLWIGDWCALILIVLTLIQIFTDQNEKYQP